MTVDVRGGTTPALSPVARARVWGGFCDYVLQAKLTPGSWPLGDEDPDDCVVVVTPRVVLAAGERSYDDPSLEALMAHVEKVLDSVGLLTMPAAVARRLGLVPSLWFGGVTPLMPFEGERDGDGWLHPSYATFREVLAPLLDDDGWGPDVRADWRLRDLGVESNGGRYVSAARQPGPQGRAAVGVTCHLLPDRRGRLAPCAISTTRSNSWVWVEAREEEQLQTFVADADTAQRIVQRVFIPRLPGFRLS